jgi:hypothetical protein
MGKMPLTTKSALLLTNDGNTNPGQSHSNRSFSTYNVWKIDNVKIFRELLTSDKYFYYNMHTCIFFFNFLFKVQWTMYDYSWTTALKCEYCAHMHIQQPPPLRPLNTHSLTHTPLTPLAPPNWQHTLTPTPGLRVHVIKVNFRIRLGELNKIVLIVQLVTALHYQILISSCLFFPSPSIWVVFRHC